MSVRTTRASRPRTLTKTPRGTNPTKGLLLRIFTRDFYGNDGGTFRRRSSPVLLNIFKTLIFISGTLYVNSLEICM